MCHECRTGSLEQEIVQLAANLNAATARLLELIEAFDRQGGWNGFNSCAHWLNYRIGLAPGAAREKVRVARALVELPFIRAAFEVGEISYSKVRALTRIALPENEQFLLQVARHGTAAHMEKMVGLYRGVKRRQTSKEAMDQAERQSLSVGYDEGGMVVIKGRFTPEQGALLLKALDAAQEEQFREDVSAETPPRPIDQRRAAGLIDMAETYLSNPDVQSSGGDRYLVMVHLDPEGDISWMDDSGKDVSAETSKRLACDASVVKAVTNQKGETLDIGRKSRSIPPAMRRALQLRDRCCRFPGCTHRRFLDGHHVKHWADGGETKLDNLVSLCRKHHRLVHEGGYQIEATSDGGFAFYDPEGRYLPAVPVPMTPSKELIECAVLKDRIDNRQRTYWDGQRMDYQHAIGALVQYEGQSRSR